MKPDVDAGRAYCAELICLMPDRWIAPGSEWDAAHDRENPGQYLGPAHARCNRSEGATFGNHLRGLLRHGERERPPVRRGAWHSRVWF